MTQGQDISAEVADAILADLRGPGYYRDPKILAEFLLGQYRDLGNPKRASEIAEAIVMDLRPNSYEYYKDPNLLAEFLRGSLERR